MTNVTRHRFKLIFLLLAGIFCLLPAARLLADDEDDIGGGGLDAEVQWKLADSAWGRREYDDAAGLSVTYATANPDHANAIEAWWRAYEIYRAYRPNEQRRKLTFDRAFNAATRWEKKYSETEKPRAAGAMWYMVFLQNNEGNRPLAVSLLEQLVKKYPGTAQERDGYWQLAEWMREAGRWKEAINAYSAYRKVVGPTDLGALAMYRSGWCFEELKDKASAIAAYGEVLTTADYNWGGYYILSGAVDAAARLKKMGEDELARKLAYKVIDKCPQYWMDFIVQARKIVGDTELPKRFSINAYVTDNYSTTNINVDAATRFTMVRDLPMLLQLQYINVDNPFKGTLTVAPKVDMLKTPPNMTKEDGANGKPVFKVDISEPDPKGNLTPNVWYNFTAAEQRAEAPDNLIITRKWEAAGKGWGQCTIRVQSSATWYFYINLPNDKTNPNNISVQPTYVLEGGKQFRYDHFDMKQGLTVKFPVEVGGNVSEFYPKIVLSRNPAARYAGTSGLGTEANFEAGEYTIKMKTEKSMPFSIGFPTTSTVTLEEVTK